MNNKDVIFYNGKIMPINNETYEYCLCIEVLEYAENPLLLLSEIYRVLKRLSYLRTKGVFERSSKSFRGGASPR